MGWPSLDMIYNRRCVLLSVHNHSARKLPVLFMQLLYQALRTATTRIPASRPSRQVILAEALR
jgi:hypothetical protein